MQMATLSRWTLAYFACALVALMLALGLIALGYGYPADDLAAPRTLILVHLVSIGWLSTLMLGALFQFLPVLVGRDLVGAALAPLVLFAILAGLACLVCGFGSLEGWPGISGEMLPVGGALLLAGFALAAGVLLATLLQGVDLNLPAGFIALALLGLLMTALLGETLASTLAGLVGGAFSVAMITDGLPLHASLGLGGWLTLAAIGVSYRLVSMFLVAPERTGPRPRIVLWLACAGLAGLCLAVAWLLLFNQVWWPLPTLSGLLALAVVAAYLADMVALYRTRRRASLELHMLAAIGAFAMLAIGAVALIAARWLDQDHLWAAALYMLALGWLGGLGLSMLYKIVPFLTWLECFAPLMGRAPTPRVQDLVREDQSRWWFALYGAATLAGGVMLLTEQASLLRLAAGAQLVAVALVIHQLVRARKLANLPDPWRNHPRPTLLLPASRRKAMS